MIKLETTLTHDENVPVPGICQCESSYDFRPWSASVCTKHTDRRPVGFGTWLHDVLASCIHSVFPNSLCVCFVWGPHCCVDRIHLANGRPMVELCPAISGFHTAFGTGFSHAQNLCPSTLG